MSTLTLIADRSTMSGGDLIAALVIIAGIGIAAYVAIGIGERRAARDNKRDEPKPMPILWDGGEK